MAEKRNQNPLGFRPPGMRGAPSRESLTRTDVTNQGRILMTQFIHDRMVSDGYTQAPTEDQLIPMGTPTGPPLDHLKEVGSALRKIGDELDGDVHLQKLIKEIPPDAPRNTFMNVAREIFADGNFNWGRVTALFYFAYKMIVKAIKEALNSIPFLRGIVECVTDILYDNVAPWIIERGGWGAIFEYFGSTNYQMIGIGVACVAVSAYVLYKYLYKSS